MYKDNILLVFVRFNYYWSYFRESLYIL